MPTNINLYNLVNGLTIQTTDPAGLDSNAYGTESVSDPLVQTTFLWFNRNVGITDGTTFNFTSTFTLGEIDFTVSIALKGTSSSSNFTIGLTATGGGNSEQTIGPISDTGFSDFDLSLPITGGNTLNYTVTLDRFLNGNYDDVTITIQPTTQTT